MADEHDSTERRSAIDRPSRAGANAAFHIEAPLTESEEPLTEGELTELALRADPSGAVADDAVPLSVFLGQGAGLLPDWYMPSPMSRHSPRWRLPVVLV